MNLVRVDQGKNLNSAMGPKMTDNEKDDLTRIEDLREYLHNDDPETDELLESSSSTSSLPPDFSQNSDNQTDSFLDSDSPPSQTPDTSFANTVSHDLENYDFESPVSVTDTHLSSENPGTSLDQGDQESTPPNHLAPQDEISSPSSTFFNTLSEYDRSLSASAPPKTESSSELPRPQTRFEKFEDIKSFAQNITTNVIAGGGNPPFSVLLKNIKFKDDALEILRILKEFGLLTHENEPIYKQSIQNGSLLISQISEYAAILLAHKLRNLDCDMEFGPSNEIHPSKSYSDHSKGLLTKHNLKQNKIFHQTMDLDDTQSKTIILTTLSSLQNYEILKYIDVISVFQSVNEAELKDFSKSLNESSPDSDEHKESNYSLKITDTYTHLNNELRQKAIKKGGNAVIGITYQISPLQDKSSDKYQTENKYKIICTGNVVSVRELT